MRWRGESGLKIYDRQLPLKKARTLRGDLRQSLGVDLLDRVFEIADGILRAGFGLLRVAFGGQ